MRKKIFFLLTFLIIFWFAAATVVGAVRPFATPPGQQKILRYSNEATERAKASNPQVFKATPPGLLRQKLATPPGKQALLKTQVYLGNVSAILPASKAFTLDTVHGPKTVQTNEQTRFIKGAFKSGTGTTFDSLKMDDRVTAVGRVDGEGLMTAKIVLIASDTKPQIKRRAVYGVVESKVATGSGTLLTLRHPKNQKTYEVLVNAQTKVTGKGLSTPTINDIEIGNRVVAVGTVDETGRITAKRVHIIPGLASGLFGTQPSTPSSKGATPPGWLKRPTATPTVTPPVPTPTPTP